MHTCMREVPLSGRIHKQYLSIGMNLDRKCPTWGRILSKEILAMYIHTCVYESASRLRVARRCRVFQGVAVCCSVLCGLRHRGS